MNFDYVIVGAGSAGCVLANRLTESSNNTVCLIEAGPSDWSPFIKIPAGFMRSVTNRNINWLYETEPSVGTNGRSIPTPRGKVVGGSSSINGLIFNRGHKLDFDGWAQRGNLGWSYEDVLPHFKNIETYIPVKQNDPDYRLKRQFRGSNGEMIVTDLKWRDPLCEAFINAALAFGIPFNSDYNAETQEGVSYVQRTATNMFRMSAARAFLKPALKRKNLRLIKNALVTKLIFNEDRVIGVNFQRNKRSDTINFIGARKEVIVSGGAINSAQLLQLSGVGPSKILLSRGIPIKRDITGVGKNLRDHLATRLTARAKNAQTINEMSRGIKLVKQMANYLIGRRSILSLGPTLVYCFWHSNESIKNNDLQISFTPASYNLGRQAILDRFPGFSIASWVQRPESSGWVNIKSADPFEKPVIQPNYLSAYEDQRIAVDGIRLSRKLMHSKELQPYFDAEVYPGDKFQSFEELLEVARNRGNTAYHLVGTCRMGPKSDPTAVVDKNLKVYGFKNLRVVDASIMPMIPSSNVNAAVLMIAEKVASEIILNK